MSSRMSCLLACCVLMVASRALLAETRVLRDHGFELDGIDTVELRGSVGSIDIVPAQGTRLEVSLEIEGRKDGWFARKQDVAAVDLRSRRRNGRLILEQTEESTETRWLLRLPAVQSTDIHLGVGSISAELGSGDVEVHLGVGEARLQFPEAAAGDIRLKVGLGEASIDGRGTDVRSRRAFVSQDVEASGDGEHDIRVDVGVGNIVLELY